jgi:hypothetical protein
MHLPKRCGRQRLRLERGERLGYANAELGLDDHRDLFERERLDVVLQPRQRFGVARRQQVGPAG